MFDMGKTFLQSAERAPHALAVIDGDLRWTYSQWALRIGALQRSLAELGIGHGDHVVSVMQNRAEAATLHWACQFAGVVMTPLNWRAKPEEVQYALQDSEANLVVYEDISSVAVCQALASGECAQVRAVRVCDDKDCNQSDKGAAARAHAPISFADCLQPLSEPVPLARAEDWSLMLYTSGTTGLPKGVPRRHRAERMASLAHVAQNQYGRGECTLGVMPLYHTMGVRSLLALALVDGTFICMPKFEAEQALRWIETERVSHLYLVPTLYHDLLAHPHFAQTDVCSVRRLGFAGAPMHDALLLRLQEAFQPDLFVNHYGSSEIYTFSINSDAVGKPGSAGRAGINTRLRVVKLNAKTPHNVAARMEEGQIIADLDSEEAFESYHNRPDANAKSLREGWYFTGDTGYVDDEGDLFVTGRVDDMIISGGENISPVDIESVISLHPAVDEVAVAGLKDERWGQRVVAFIKRKSAVDGEQLDAHCRASDLINFKRPREYVFVQEIPKSPVGKVLRRKLVAGDYSAEPLPKDFTQPLTSSASH
jgi:2-furoate---CoA ligase